MNMKKEIDEALFIGTKLINTISEAEKYLDKAENLGIWDLLGGKSFVTYLKHKNITKANRKLEEAFYLSREFQKELGDVTSFNQDFISIDGFLKFADYWFDGFLADYMVQNKINDAQKELWKFKNEIMRAMDELRALSRE